MATLVPMRVYLGSDHAGFELKQILGQHLEQNGHQVLDVGAGSTQPVDYPDYAEAVALSVRRGDAERGYQLARRHDPGERSGSSLLPLLDELGAGLRVFLARLQPRASGQPDVRHKGVEAVTVARGLVQIELGDRRAALRAGEALLAEASSITGWRNVGESEAMLFWILRDARSWARPSDHVPVTAVLEG